RIAVTKAGRRLARARASPTRALSHRRAARSSSRDTPSDRAASGLVVAVDVLVVIDAALPAVLLGGAGGHARPTRGEPTVKQATARSPGTTQWAHRKPRLMKEVVESNLATTSKTPALRAAAEVAPTTHPARRFRNPSPGSPTQTILLQ